MKKLHKFLAVGLLGLFAASCSDDGDNITPADITNLRAESTPGRIVLRWDTPEDASSIEYIQVNYYDHKTEVNNKRLASIYADSIDIPNTRARYGQYDFTVKTVSPSGNYGQEMTVSCVSEPATPTFIKRELDLKAEDLSSNAPEASEGPIANCVDGDNNTFFHTSWSTYLKGPHYLQVNLNQTISGRYCFQYVTRHNNANDVPWNFDLLGSKDGNEWFILQSFAQNDDNTFLPTTAGTAFDSEIFEVEAGKEFSMIRFSVNGTKAHKYDAETQANNDIYWGPWWAIGEFRFWNVEIIDPEDPAMDI